jgi:hypothetical protein
MNYEFTVTTFWMSINSLYTCNAKHQCPQLFFKKYEFFKQVQLTFKMQQATAPVAQWNS